MQKTINLGHLTAVLQRVDEAGGHWYKMYKTDTGEFHHVANEIMKKFNAGEISKKNV